MEEKKVLDEKNIEKVSGGRDYLREPLFRDLARKEEIIKAAASYDPLPSKPLPEELLAKVSGGDTQTYFAHCPKCGEWEVLETYPGGWEIYCPVCNIIYDASYIEDW